MKNRSSLNTLVVAILDTNDNPLKAREIFETIRNENTNILIQNKTPTFKSFVKVLNQFSQVESMGLRKKQYFYKQRF